MGDLKPHKGDRTQNMTPDTNQPAGESKLPTHNVYHVRERDGGKGFWSQIGAAWAHKDGKGFSIQIATVPLDGRITLRVVTESKE